MYLQKRVPEVSLQDRLERLVDRTLLAKSKEHGACSNGHKKHAPDAVHPGAVITGLGQIETTGVHHGQGCLCVDAAVVLQHGDLLVVYGSGSGQQLVFQMFLGHIVQVAAVVDNAGINGRLFGAVDDEGNTVPTKGLEVSSGGK